MANVTFLHNNFSGRSIPPDGTEFFTLGPADVFRTGGAITVTAIPRQGTPGAKLFMEVVQMAVRNEPQTFAESNYLLDIVVRKKAIKMTRRTRPRLPALTSTPRSSPANVTGC